MKCRLIIFCTGISTWGKRVGRKFDSMKLGESSDRLHYVVTPPSNASNFHQHEIFTKNESDNHHETSSEICTNNTIEFLVVNDDLILQRKPHLAVSQPDLVIAGQTEQQQQRESSNGKVKRRISRVESLRNLFFNKSTNPAFEARRKFQLNNNNKKRAKSAEKTTVDKAIGTDCSDFEDDFFSSHHHHSQYDDLDSVSQISAMDSASQTGGCGGSLVNDSSSSRFHQTSKSFSSDSNIHQTLVTQPQHSSNSSSNHHHYPPSTRRPGQFPYAYIRSKLSVLPEEQAGQLSRRESMNKNDEVFNK